MNTLIPNTIRWVTSKLGFTMWLHRAYSRNELRTLSDRDLRDIGVTRIDARQEYAKPFWSA